MSTVTDDTFKQVNAYVKRCGFDVNTPDIENMIQDMCLYICEKVSKGERWTMYFAYLDALYKYRRWTDYNHVKHKKYHQFLSIESIKLNQLSDKEYQKFITEQDIVGLTTISRMFIDGMKAKEIACCLGTCEEYIMDSILNEIS